MSKNIYLAVLFSYLVFLSGCGGSDPESQDTNTNIGSNTGNNTGTTTGDNVTDISTSLPYSDALTTSNQAIFKVTNGVDGEIYAFTLNTTTAGTMLDFNIYPDANFFPSIGYDVATVLQDAEIILQAQGSSAYLKVSKNSGDAASIDYTINIQTYDDYAGLIDLTGIYPYAGTVNPDSSQPYQVGGLQANTSYQLSFSNITNDISIIANNDKLKMIDESYIPCSGFVTTASFSCNVTTDNQGFMFIKITNSSGFTINYDIDIN